VNRKSLLLDVFLCHIVEENQVKPKNSTFFLNFSCFLLNYLLDLQHPFGKEYLIIIVPDYLKFG